MMDMLPLPELYELRNDERRQRVRERMEADLEHIEEIAQTRRGGVINPFPQGTMETLIGIPHVLEKIFDNLETVEDLNTASDACDLFKSILSPRTTGISLPQVLNILVENGALLEFTDRRDAFRLIMNLRQVCSSWWKSINTELFENGPSQRLEDEWCSLEKIEGLTDRRFELIEYLQLELTDVEKIRKARSKLTQGSPFLRFVIIAPDKSLFGTGKENDKQHFEEEARELLEEFGSSVWHFTYACHESHFYYAYELLQSWTLYLPNLRSLWINMTRLEITLSGYNRVPLDQSIARLPFPPIPSLKFLKCRSVHPSFVYEITRTNNGIRCVDFGRQQYITHFQVDDKLERVSLNGNVPMMALTRLLFRSRWHLKVIKLDMLRERNPTGLETIEPEIIFRLAESFKDTLVEFYMEHLTFKTSRQPSYLDLPHLQKLSITLSPRLNQIDYLWRLKFLEELTIGLSDDNPYYVEEYNENESIKIKGYIINCAMDESNIWDVFPFLKILETRWTQARRPANRNLRPYSGVQYERKTSGITKFVCKVEEEAKNETDELMSDDEFIESD